MPVLRFTARRQEYLVAVGQAGSIALAARRLHVSSPSISTSLTQLEAEFGLPLFMRRPAQGLTPTQGVRLFMQAALTMLASAGHKNDLASTITGQSAGPLAMGCLVTIAQAILPRLRLGFLARHPGVTFLQFAGEQAALYDGLRQRTLDAALTYDLVVPSDLKLGIVTVDGAQKVLMMRAFLDHCHAAIAAGTVPGIAA